MLTQTLLTKAKRGESKYYSELASRYESGSGVEQSIDSAIYWMRLASVYDIPSKYKLIRLLRKRNSAEDLLESFALIESLAKNNDPRAQRLLGLEYRSGLVVEYNLDKAIFWMKKAYESDESIGLDLVNLLELRDNEEDADLIINICSGLLSNPKIKETIKTTTLIKMAGYYFKGKYVKEEREKSIDLINTLPETEEKQLLLSDLYYYTFSNLKAKELLFDEHLNQNTAAAFRRRLWVLEKRDEDKKLFVESVLNIMVLSSNEYAKYAAVLVKSVCLNNATRNIRFFIITSQMRDNNKKYIEDALGNNASVSFIDVDYSIFDVIKYPGSSFNSQRWIKLSLVRLIPHLLLPDTVDKVLSLGADVVVDGDLSDIYDVSLGDYIAAATLSGENHSSYCKTSKDEIYRINGDVLLFNLKKMRELNINLSNYSAFVKDQCTEEQLLPSVFSNSLMILDTALFNYRLGSIYADYKSNKILFPKPVIIQYIDYKKPWHMFVDSEFRESPLYSMLDVSEIQNNLFRIWWKYAKLCPHYLDLYADMKVSRYAIAYHRYYTKNS